VREREEGDPRRGRLKLIPLVMARGHRRETRRDVSSLQPPGTLPGYGLGTFLVLFLLSVIFSSLQSYRHHALPASSVFQPLFSRFLALYGTSCRDRVEFLLTSMGQSEIRSETHMGQITRVLAYVVGSACNTPQQKTFLA
jgi:hypothetical protein